MKQKLFQKVSMLQGLRARTIMTLIALLCFAGGVSAQQELPYEYGFENGDLTTDGWIANITSANSGILSGGPEHSGNVGFAFYYSEQNGSLISPLLLGGDNGVDVSFWYVEYSSQYGDEQFQVGYTTDETVTDADGFTYGDVITASVEWQQYENTFPAGTKRIAIKYIYNNAFYLFLDDFSFEASSAYAKPTDLSVSELTTNSAIISWTAPADEVSGYVYQYKKATDEDWGAEARITATSATLSGLAHGTAYNFRVKALYEEDNESSYVTINFTTDCETFAIPYSYGFEDEADMTCWTMLDCELLNGYWGDASDYARTGNGIYYFSSYSGTTEPQYFISPELSGIVSGLHVEFYYMNGGNGVETFKVGYSTSDTNPDNFIWGDELTATESYKRFSANYPANVKYVAVQYTSADSYYLFLDDFLFEEAASCLEPTGLAVSNVTTTGATISWTAGGDEAVWDIYVTNDIADEPDESTTPTVANITTNPYELTGLTSCTIYYVYLRSKCSEESASAWSVPFVFHTDCEPISLPYEYAFEDSELPISWSIINTNPAYLTTGITEGSGNGGNALQFYNGSLTGIVAAVLPEIDTDNYPLNGYQISFDACFSGTNMTSGKLGVGVMTDPNDFSTFELVEEVDITTGYTTYGSYTVMFNNYTGAGRYIAIRDIRTQTGYVLVDNIAVTELPTCLPVANVTVTTVTTTSATLSWTNNDDSQDTWQICLNDDEENLITANSNPFTVEGLTALTAYTAKVRAYCSESDQSAWSDPVSFTTSAEPVSTFPWTEDFNELTVANSIPEGWDNSEGTIPATSPAYKWCYNTSLSAVGGTNGTSYDGTNCVRFNSYNPQSGQTNFLKTVPLALPDEPELQLTFWYKNPTGGDFSVYISTDGGATYETALVTGLTNVSEWTKIAPISLSDYAGQQVIIVFKGTSNYGNGDAYIYLDDVTVEEVPSCAAPSGLAVDNITTNSAELSWTANSGETEWTLYYKKATDTEYTEVTEVTENPYTLTGLESATDYQFYVTAICSVTDQSVASGVCRFTTDCDVFVVDADHPFFEDFEGTTFVPDCWGSIMDGTNKWSRISNSYYPTHSGSACARSGYSGDVYLVMPAIQIADDAVLSFWSFNSYPDDYEKNSIVLLDGSDETELWTTDAVTSEWVNIVVDLSAYKGQTIKIAFKYEGYNAHDWYVDDVQIVVPTDISLDNDSEENSSVVGANAGKTANVTLAGRTLYKDTYWNTLCLPFDVTLAESSLEGAIAKTLSEAAITGDHVTLTFGDAVDVLKAGVPYIIKWEEEGENISEPLFRNVLISSIEGQTIEKADGNVLFVGYYDAFELDRDDDAPYTWYMTGNNTLKHSEVNHWLKACRAYFFIPETNGVRSFTLDFGEGGISTSIDKLPAELTGEGEWYSVDGMKLAKQPTRKGVYVNNGKKIVVK